MRSIYALVDPRSPREYRYVGETKNGLRVRLNGHIQASRRRARLRRRLSPVNEWIASLIEDGIRLGIVLLERCERKTWKARERRAISLYRNRGHRLLNVNPGGAGSEDGGIKKICECGTRRKKGRCPKCRRAWKRAYSLAWSRTPKGQAYRRTFMRTLKYHAWDHARNRTPKRRAYLRAYNRSPKKLAANRVWTHKNRTAVNAAERLGITLAEYRIFQPRLTGALRPRWTARRYPRGPVARRRGPR